MAKKTVEERIDDAAESLLGLPPAVKALCYGSLAIGAIGAVTAGYQQIQGGRLAGAQTAAINASTETLR